MADGTLPFGAFQTLIAWLRSGEKPTLKDTLGALLEVAGYAYRQMYSAPVVASVADEKLCDHDGCTDKCKLAELLENCCHQHRIEGVTMAVGLPWMSILAALLKLLPLFLGEKEA